MMDAMRFGVTCLLILLTCAAVLSGCGERKEREDNKPEGRQPEYTGLVTFLDAEGDSIATIDVAVADDEPERNTGLMDVNELPSDKGMLFIFEDEQPRSFWMANTPLSLDIVFVNEEMEIVRIHHSTQPFAEKSLSSEQPARYVVETNGGFCVSHDIREGMSIRFKNPKHE